MEILMKKMTAILTVMALLLVNAGHAQSNGKGAAAGTTAANNDFAWVIGLGGVALLGVVVGVTAAAATSSPSSFSH